MGESCKRKKKETESPEVITKETGSPDVVTQPEVVTLPTVVTIPETTALPTEPPTKPPTAQPCTSPCWPNSWLAGYGIDMERLGRHFNVADYKACDQLCFAHYNCKFFTYAEASNSCQMITVNLYKGSDKGFTAGKVGCSRVDERLAEQNKAEKK